MRVRMQGLLRRGCWEQKQEPIAMGGRTVKLGRGSLALPRLLIRMNTPSEKTKGHPQERMEPSPMTPEALCPVVSPRLLH